MTSKITFLVDDRKGSKPFAKLLTTKTTEAVLCMLQSGDVVFAGNMHNGRKKIAIEIKAVLDLYSSYGRGRVFDQLHRMSSDYERTYLLVYLEDKYLFNSSGLLMHKIGRRRGKPVVIAGRQIKWQTVCSMMQTIRESGFSVVYESQGQRKAAEHIIILARWFSRSWNSHKGFVDTDLGTVVSRNVIPGGLNFRRKIKLLTTFPGIGPEQALEIMENHGSIGKFLRLILCKDWEAAGVTPRVGQGIRGLFE